MKVEIEFYEAMPPCLKLTEEGEKSRYMDLSDLECFLIRHCFLMTPAEVDEWDTLLNGFKMLERACSGYLSFLIGKGSCVELIHPPNVSIACKSILEKRNSYEMLEY